MFRLTGWRTFVILSMVDVLVWLGLSSGTADAKPNPVWRLARTPHFEVYSDAGLDSTLSLLEDFERLRAFFERETGLITPQSRAVRVVCFASRQEYKSFSLRPAADAYFLGTEDREYIVMPAGSANRRSVAAHEYVHALMRASGSGYPEWLREGVAEVFSSVSITEHESTVGGDVRARLELLRRTQWLPLAELAAPGAHNRYGLLYYAQSWALTHMLLFSGQYGARLSSLVSILASGHSTEQALGEAYGKSLEAIAGDLRAWIGGRRPTPAVLPGVVVPPLRPDQLTLSSFEQRMLMADLRMAAGDLSRAEPLYRELARESPESAEVWAALGGIAHQRGRDDEARKAWRRAVELGISDPVLCYRYAALADEAGADEDGAQRALERAIALKRDFDDAHWKLALMYKNSGRSQDALSHLRAMRAPGPKRAFAYWMALADALLDLGERTEAARAAARAREQAQTEEERARVAELDFMAATEMAVQMTADSQGRQLAKAVRIPRDAVMWNPFVQPGDRIRRVEGTLVEINCAAVQLIVAVPEGLLTLALKPSQVQIRNAPGLSFEFTCGPQPPRKVRLEYAAWDGNSEGGVVRGLEFEGSGP